MHEVFREKPVRFLQTHLVELIPNSTAARLPAPSGIPLSSVSMGTCRLRALVSCSSEGDHLCSQSLKGAYYAGLSLNLLNAIQAGCCLCRSNLCQTSRCSGSKQSWWPCWCLAARGGVGTVPWCLQHQRLHPAHQALPLHMCLLQSVLPQVLQVLDSIYSGSHLDFFYNL